MEEEVDCIMGQGGDCEKEKARDGLEAKTVVMILWFFCFCSSRRLRMQRRLLVL